MSTLYTVVEVAETLHVSQATIRKWVLMRKIGFVKIGNCVRFREEDIEKILKEGLT